MKITERVKFEGADGVLRMELGLGHRRQSKDYRFSKIYLLFGVEFSEFINSLEQINKSFLPRIHLGPAYEYQGI